MTRGRGWLLAAVLWTLLVIASVRALWEAGKGRGAAAFACLAVVGVCNWLIPRTGELRRKDDR